MLLRLLLLFFFILKTCFCDKNNEETFFNYPKCCNSESVFKKFVNTSFICTKDVDLRLQIQVQNTNAIVNQNDSNCIEIFDNQICLFDISVRDKIIWKKALNNVMLFPKCCPLNYVYNSERRSCTKAESQITGLFINKSFVQVGLPHCKIIVDETNIDNLLEEFIETSGFKRNAQKHCIDHNVEKKYIVRTCLDNFSICEKIKCVHKCCPDGQSYINGSNCMNTYIHGLELHNFSQHIESPNDNYAIIHGFAQKIYPLRLSDHFQLDRFGNFTLKETIKENEKTKTVVNNYSVYDEFYCIEHAIKGSMNTYSFFVAFGKDNIPLKFIYTRIAMSISCFFLALTIIYYCFSKEKQTTFGKILISYCFASFVVFVLFSYLAYERPDYNGCVILAFLVYYMTLASFTWMNIMSIDIYWTFGSFKAYSNLQHKSKELKRFIIYSIYGWGLPMVLTGITILFYNVAVLPIQFTVIIEEKRCFLSKGNGNYGQFLFLTTYLAILQIVNLILFIKTVLCCLKVKKDITKMNDTNTLKGEKKRKFNNFKDRFGLVMKLFLIMGVQFVFEVVSPFYNFRTNETTIIIEIIWDTVVSLQGFFIFVIFILKKRIFLNCQKRLAPRLRKVSLMSSIMTQTTTVPPTAKK